MQRRLSAAGISRSGASSGFDPNTIAGLAAWWDPTDLGAGAVSSWAAKVGAYTLTQATGSKQPTVSTIGTRKAVLFDGIDDYLSAGDVLDVGTKYLSMFAVIDRVSNDPTQNKNYGGKQRSSMTYGAYGFFQRSSEGTGKMYGRFINSNKTFLALGTAWTGPKVCLIQKTRANPQTTKLLINNDAYTDSHATADANDYNTSLAFELGGSSEGSSYCVNARYGDVLVYLGDSLMSDSERDIIVGWLMSRWGLS